LLSYGCIIGFIQFMIHLEHGSASDVAHAVGIFGGMAVNSIWGFVLYRIGRQAGCWSSVARRVWRLAGWFAIAVLCLDCATVGIEFIAALLRR
jgi:hypothetical protein